MGSERLEAIGAFPSRTAHAAKATRRDGDAIDADRPARRDRRERRAAVSDDDRGSSAWPASVELVRECADVGVVRDDLSAIAGENRLEHVCRPDVAGGLMRL